MVLQRKVCDSEIKEFNEGDLSVVHFISSELPDRGGDILYAAKNDKGAGMVMFGRPVVLQQHGWGEMGMEPIAKPISIKVAKFKDRNGIECKTQFFPDDLGRRLFKKTSEGYMPNWSVGWRPMEGKVEVKGDIRHVYEWELLEYSIVGVPMQPDAQTGEIASFLFKMIPEEEDRFGELAGWKREEDGLWEEKPYPDEHACRLEDPDKYIRIRRQNDKFGKAIHAIWGVRGGGKPVELQAIRFAKSKFTAAEARTWVKDHKYKCKLFEPASKKCVTCGEPMGIAWAEMFDLKTECEKSCVLDFEYVCPKCKEDKQAADGDAVEELPFDPQSDEDVGFVMVDADEVRSDHGTEDFIHAGHHYTFDFIPEPEIWIDQRMTDVDIMKQKMSLFVERQMMKYCEITLAQDKEVGSISGKWIVHMMDPEVEGGGHHDEKDMHYFTHDGNHWHNRGQTMRYDSETERYVVHSLGVGLTKDQKEAFEKDIDMAIKQIAIKHGLREAPPAEPEVGKEKPAINPPEPRKIVIFTEQDRKKAEQDRKKQLSEMLEPVAIQIEGMIKKIPDIVKEELDKLKGRVK